jgi:hypothetical protein
MRISIYTKFASYVAARLREARRRQRNARLLGQLAHLPAYIARDIGLGADDGD